MAIQSDETLVTKGDLKDLYQDKILPYLGGNMMMTTNVSDYYDTNEKIVGVWTDGRPVYQRVAHLPDQSSHGDYVEISTVSWNIDKPISAHGYAKYKGNSFYDTIPMGGSRAIIWFNGSYLGFNCDNLSQYFTEIYIICQYTKTTDAANSAAATPGCYDLNRPDLWPVRKEIFFGNGLYGYRITGNFTAAASKQRWETDVISLNPETGRIVSTGGSFSVRDASSRLARCTLNSTVVGADAGGNVIIFIESYFYSRSFTGIVVFQVMPDNDFSLTANDTYDVWLTYTK